MVEGVNRYHYPSTQTKPIMQLLFQLCVNKYKCIPLIGDLRMQNINVNINP